MTDAAAAINLILPAARCHSPSLARGAVRQTLGAKLAEHNSPPRARPCDRCLVSRVTTHVYPPLHQLCTHTRRITTRNMSPRDALVALGRRQCAPATARGARARLSIERARERVARVFSRVSFANAVDAEAPTREETPETPWGFDFGAKPRPRRARRIVGEGCLKRPRGRRSPRRSERWRRACGAGARGA